ncbi:MAG: hypothetical protein HY551_02735, partial [Elusimicrobia bacterium]|nr:hypothetical protein [Elusimicrobiota bacterium]
VTVERGHGTRMLLVNRGLTMRILDWIENPAHPAEAEGVGVSTPTVSTETAPGAAAGMEPEDDAPELPPDEPARE